MYRSWITLTCLIGFTSLGWALPTVSPATGSDLDFDRLAFGSFRPEDGCQSYHFVARQDTCDTLLQRYPRLELGHLAVWNLITITDCDQSLPLNHLICVRGPSPFALAPQNDLPRYQIPVQAPLGLPPIKPIFRRKKRSGRDLPNRSAS